MGGVGACFESVRPGQEVGRRGVGGVAVVRGGKIFLTLLRLLFDLFHFRDTVGKIPAGKWNVRVFLSAAADVDVQIYDEDDKSKFPEGKAVVAWCANAKTCNIGALGSDEGAGAITYKQFSLAFHRLSF